jgi:hypothetical protein
MNNERIPSTMTFFFSIKHLESSFVGGLVLKKIMVLIFSAISNNFGGESNYVDHDHRLDIIIFRR